ncbi:Allantoate amidohydrolase [Capillimicrobium parvum]|uniref:Allantoate amidohydrolase n=1 Tax=Capillimicrobium parvum TaxID=2884022 RepID=A0A9E6XUG7_9ACTN|nr:Allantoate amidohydrolase [Capillimicrobium parvum]
MRELVERIAREERLEATIERHYAVAPVAMDPRVIAAIEAAAAEEGVPALRMFSGAGHDAMNVAPRAPAGMLFVPSRGGLSHTPREWTDAADCELGARVLARTLRALSAGAVV